MTERVVDVFEKIEVDAENPDTVAGRLILFQSQGESLLISDPVWQIRQTVVVRHMDDSGFGFLLLRNIDNRDKLSVMSIECDAAPECQHLNLAAISLQMPPVPGGMIDIADIAQSAGVNVPLVAGPDVAQFHTEKLVAAKSIMLNGGIIHAEKIHCSSIENPHRHRIAVEQQSE